MTGKRYLRGSTEQCPKCGSRKVAFDPHLEHAGYGPGLATCPNCKTLWEPFAPEAIWDKDDPQCSFKQPCNNCAFRKGSPEQADPEEWAKIMENVKHFGGFYCHKGVPITPDAEHGFAYPMLPDGTPDKRRVRHCRGYINAAFSRLKHKQLGGRRIRVAAALLPSPPQIMEEGK